MTQVLLNPTVQVTGGAGPVGPIWANVASLVVPNLRAGEWLLCGMDVESTQASALTYNTAVTTEVVAGTFVGDSGEYVIRAATMNNTQNNHHLLLSRTSLFQVVTPARNVFTLMLAADSDVAGANDTYTIEALSAHCLMYIVRIG